MKKPRYKPQICSKCGKTSYRGLTKKMCINCLRAYKQSLAPKIECQCIDPNCKILIPSIDVFGNPKKYVKGHSSKGSGNAMYKGGISNDDEYIIIHKPDHPFARTNGFVSEHRLVMEKHLGRYLTKDEHVHHKDKNKKNNDISNLQLVSNSEHMKLHKAELREDRSNINCNFCGGNKTKINKYGFPEWYLDINGFLCRNCYEMIYNLRKKFGLI